jgi:hypothetical protein
LQGKFRILHTKFDSEKKASNKLRKVAFLANLSFTMTMNSENTVGLYIAVAIYFLLLPAASVIAYRWKQRSSEAKPVESQSDAIEGHFLANRSFGWLVTAGTVL